MKLYEALGAIRDMTPAGLAYNGWAEAENREELSLRWAKSVLWAGSSVGLVEREIEAFSESGKPFEPPTATLLADGSVSLTYWTFWSNDSAGLTEYYRQERLIDADGNLGQVERIDEFVYSQW